jgi:undecaprenyl-diphosphatase
MAGGELASALDHAARRVIREGRMLELERPMRAISTLGSGDVLVPLTFVTSITLWRRHRAVALWLPVIALLAGASLTLAKWIIDTPRPSLRAYGFPSGHVFGATVFVIVGVYLLWALDVARPWRRFAALAGAVFVTAVGYSRIFVNAHWLSDVVGGLVAGVAFGVLMVLLLDSRAVGAVR